MTEKPETYTGEPLDEDAILTLDDLCRVCSVETDWVALLVDEGVIDPITGTETLHWRFSITSLRRVRTARRLQRDLGLNMAGIGLALELLDEIELLRNRVDSLEKD